MEELLGVTPKPHLSENYIPPLDVTPQTYDIAINNDLAFEGKNYNRRNNGYRGLIGFAELIRIARDSFSRDPKRRRDARLRTRRAH